MVDNVPQTVYENMEKVSSQFTTEKHEKTLIEAFSNIFENRKNLIKQAIENGFFRLFSRLVENLCKLITLFIFIFFLFYF
jgi:F0F1-type ATP synthase delta subunit